jgi:chromate transporter
MSPTLAVLAGLFGHGLLLSLLSIGGAITVAPEMQRWLVTEQHWLGDAEFTSSIAVAQAAPGPTRCSRRWSAITWPGWPGRRAADRHPAAVLGPGPGRLALGPHPRRLALGARVQGGHGADHAGADRGHRLAARHPARVGAAPLALTLAAALLAWRTRLHLLWLIGAGALLGALGLV